MAKVTSPVLGYNTNIRHHGKLYHVQTEDSGIEHPHIITHLYADGGRIIASKKTSYAAQAALDDYREIVKKMMKAQHRAIMLALRDGIYDEPSSAAAATPPRETSGTTQPTPVAQQSESVTQVAASKPATTGALATAAPATSNAPAASSAVAGSAITGSAITGSAITGSAAAPKPVSIQSVQPAVNAPSMRPSARRRLSHTGFGSEVLSEKSLDEVILSFLSDEENTSS